VCPARADASMPFWAGRIFGGADIRCGDSVRALAPLSRDDGASRHRESAWSAA
jgi:hypothetical protein